MNIYHCSECPRYVDPPKCSECGSHLVHVIGDLHLTMIGLDVHVNIYKDTLGAYYLIIKKPSGQREIRLQDIDLIHQIADTVEDQDAPEGISYNSHTKYTATEDGSIVVLSIQEYDDGEIIVSGEKDHITQAALARWAENNYPSHRFRFLEVGRGYVGVSGGLVQDPGEQLIAGHKPGTCPHCEQELKHGDGVETPALYCDNCGMGWDNPDEVESEYLAADPSAHFEEQCLAGLVELDHADLDPGEHFMDDDGRPKGYELEQHQTEHELELRHEAEEDVKYG